MKKFTEVVTNLNKVLADGMYKEERGYIFIDTKNKELVDSFNEIQRNKVILESIEFVGNESDTIFSGLFMVESIFQNLHTFLWEIHLKKSIQ